MTLDDAKKVAEIIRWADGGCPVCVDALIDLANEAFPDLIFTMAEDFDERGYPVVIVASKKDKGHESRA